ncbi:hypothetical protein JHU04_000256 [Brenneria sp. 4F2]|nr:hypothetical protein [Brenneria bubanii]
MSGLLIPFIFQTAGIQIPGSGATFGNVVLSGAAVGGCVPLIAYTQISLLDE